MFGYRVPAPSQAMLISGGKQRTADGGTLPFRIVVGHGAFVLPVLRKASFLTLAIMAEPGHEKPPLAIERAYSRSPTLRVG